MWDPKQALVLGPQAIEALNGEDAASGKIQNLRLGDRQAEAARKAHAEVLALDAAAQIDAVGQHAELGFENVGCGRGAVGDVPFAIEVEQGGLLLCARQRDAKLLVPAEPQGVVGEVGDDLRDLGVADWPAFDPGNVGCLGAVRQKLKGPDAVTPNGREQAVGIGAGCACTLRDGAADIGVVWEQVIKDGKDRGPGVAVLAQGERVRDRDGVLPGEPLRSILEFDSPRRLTAKTAYEPAVEADVERSMGRLTRQSEQLLDFIHGN